MDTAQMVSKHNNPNVLFIQNSIESSNASIQNWQGHAPEPVLSETTTAQNNQKQQSKTFNSKKSNIHPNKNSVDIPPQKEYR